MLIGNEKDKLIVGFKQSKRAIINGSAEKLYLAEDCDPMLTSPIEKLAEENGLQVFYISSMKELGSMCGIDVKASCAVITK